MDRRRFVKFALGAVSVSASGCVGGSDDSPDTSNTDGGTAGSDAEPAEFGYKTWVPAGGYNKIAYADLGRLRDRTTLETDEETATVAGDFGPTFADVDGYISTDTEDAYSGSFDADALASGITDALSDTEETEYRGYTVIRGTEDGTNKEVIVSGSFVVSSQGEGGATGYVDAAVGEAERAAEASQIIQDISEYTEDPLLVVFTPGGLDARYKFVEATEGRLDYITVTPPVLRDEGSRNRFLNRTSPRRKYNESTLGSAARNTTAEIQNNTGIVSSPTDDIDSLLEEFFMETGSSSLRSS